MCSYKIKQISNKKQRKEFLENVIKFLVIEICKYFKIFYYRLLILIKNTNFNNMYIKIYCKAIPNIKYLINILQNKFYKYNFFYYSEM